MPKSSQKTPEQKTPGKRTPVGGGVYKYTDKYGEVSYQERPFINGKRTWRKLGCNGTKQTNLKLAREEYCRRRAEVAAGRDPYKAADDKESTPTDKPTVSGIVKDYVAAEYPDRYLKPKTGRTREGEEAACENLLEYWNGDPWDSIKSTHWDLYHAHRIANINKGKTTKRGDRAVDLERNALNNAYKYAIRRGIIDHNPAQKFPKFHASTAVKHCREFKPESADELHNIAKMFFDAGRDALGWQILMEAYTNLRTNEVLMLRMDASRWGEPGYVDPEGNLHVQRSKHGINPFVHVNEGLKALLAAHKTWHKVNHPNSVWFLPGRLKKHDKPMTKGALALALRKMRPKIGRKITSHGMRAWYVFVQRSWGIDDAVIAIQLGQGSGPGLISTTYGDVPANWRNGGGPKLSWLPKGEPAWAAIETKA